MTTTRTRLFITKAVNDFLKKKFLPRVGVQYLLESRSVKEACVSSLTLVIKSARRAMWQTVTSVEIGLVGSTRHFVALLSVGEPVDRVEPAQSLGRSRLSLSRFGSPWLAFDHVNLGKPVATVGIETSASSAKAADPLGQLSDARPDSF